MLQVASQAPNTAQKFLQTIYRISIFNEIRGLRTKELGTRTITLPYDDAHILLLIV